jgi:hypothetical protein
VKCDEKQPVCDECNRLDRDCLWFHRGQTSIKSSKQGYGPVKSRVDYIAPEIAPKTGGTLAPLGVVVTEPRTNVSSPSECDIPLFLDELPRSNKLPQELDADGGRLADVELPENMFSRDGAHVSDDFSQDFVQIEEISSIYSASHLLINHGSRGISPSLSLSHFHMALPNSLQLSFSEHEALRHYQTTYSLYRTTKDPNWSTHKVLLRMGSHEKMIMHLILAVSLNDYAIRTGHSSCSQEAEGHFQIGVQHLIKTSSTGLKPDYAVMMAAYFFLYLYMSKPKSTTTLQLNRLSLIVLDFVKSQDLLNYCINSHTTSIASCSKNTISSYSRSLLARLIMWTLDEDVKCSFQGFAGHFAEHLALCDGKTKEIYDVSRNALGDHWGLSYPHIQALDDDQNSTVLEFLWELMALWQNINDMHLRPNIPEQKLRIEQKFSLLEEVRKFPLCPILCFSNLTRNIRLSFDTHPKSRTSLVLEFSSMQTSMSFYSMLSGSTISDLQSSTFRE